MSREHSQYLSEGLECSWHTAAAGLNASHTKSPLKNKSHKHSLLTEKVQKIWFQLHTKIHDMEDMQFFTEIPVDFCKKSKNSVYDKNKKSSLMKNKSFG